jgi:hypothetical protein
VDGQPSQELGRIMSNGVVSRLSSSGVAPGTTVSYSMRRVPDQSGVRGAAKLQGCPIRMPASIGSNEGRRSFAASVISRNWAGANRSMTGWTRGDPPTIASSHLTVNRRSPEGLVLPKRSIRIPRGTTRWRTLELAQRVDQQLARIPRSSAASARTPPLRHLRAPVAAVRQRLDQRGERDRRGRGPAMGHRRRTPGRS